jgi:hypothetical protein
VVGCCWTWFLKGWLFILLGGFFFFNFLM